MQEWICNVRCRPGLCDVVLCGGDDDTWTLHLGKLFVLCIEGPRIITGWKPGYHATLM
jgi:hypothetical protein